MSDTAAVQGTQRAPRVAGSGRTSRLTALIGATLLLSFLATIIPARRAGSLVPVDVLRYE